MADVEPDEVDMQVDNTAESMADDLLEADEDIYEVERIVGMCNSKGKTLYKVRWQGYSPTYDTWEPYDNLSSCKDMIDTYIEDQKGSNTKSFKDESSFGDGTSEMSDTSKTEAKKKKKAAGFYYVSDDAEEADTLKDKFWRDLEHGKINVFESGDMYSKVKGAGARQSRPPSFGDMNQNPPLATAGTEDKSSKIKQKTKSKSDTSKARRLSKSRNSTNSMEDVAKKKTAKKRKSTSRLSKQDSVTSVTSLASDSSSTFVKTEDSSSNSVTSPPCEEPAEEEPFPEGEEPSPEGEGEEPSPEGEEPFPEGEESVEQQSKECVQTQPTASGSEELACTWTDSLPTSSSDSNVRSVSESWYVESESPASQPETGQDSPGCVISSQSAMSQSTDSIHCTSVSATPPRDTQCEASTSLSTINSATASHSPHKDTSHRPHAGPTGATEVDHQPLSVSNTQLQTPPSVGESELSGDSGHVDMDSIPRSNHSLVNTCGDIADEEFEFDLNELEGMEWEGKVLDTSNTPGLSSNTELRQAVKVNDYQRVSQAFRTMRQFDLEQHEHGGLSLAMIASQQGYDDLLELLVMKGANINAEQKGTGVTALMLAAEQGLRCTVALLLEMGAFMNVQTINGDTALLKAIKRGQSEIVNLFVDHGANFASTTGNDNTAIRCAKLLNNTELHSLLSSHISRVTAEFERQVQITLNNTAKIQTALFPIQCLALRESEKLRVSFKHELQPTRPGVGMLLFIAHARISSQEARCRFYGPCAVSAVYLNGVQLKSLTEETNFVLSFSPLHNGRNDLEIVSVKAPTSHAKLMVCAYQTQLM